MNKILTISFIKYINVLIVYAFILTLSCSNMIGDYMGDTKAPYGTFCINNDDIFRFEDINYGMEDLVMEQDPGKNCTLSLQIKRRELFGRWRVNIHQ